MIIPQGSRFRRIWDVLILLLIFSSCWLVPAQVAFMHDVFSRGTTILLLIDLIFLVDMALNFFTTYRSGGIEVRDPKKTSRHYLRTVFVFDLLANLPIDLLFLAHQDVRVGNVSIVLVLRMTRLLRVVRLFVIFRRWEQFSGTNSGALRIAKLLSVVTLVTHWIACAWFFVAFLEGFPPDSWVAIAGLTNADPLTQYIRSLYWAIVTMTTVGYGDITPHRTIEYLFTSIAMVMGASVYAFLVGNIASLLSSLDASKAAFRNRIEAADRYLRHRQVPVEVSERVQDYYEYFWSRNRGLSHDAFLHDLPESLRLEVLQHLMKDFLSHAPIFRHCSDALRNELLLSLHPVTYPPGGFIAREGERGQAIFFLHRGEVEITSGEGEDEHGTLAAGESFGDLSLILGEQRTGSVRAQGFCELLVLTKADFQRIKESYPEFKETLKHMSAERSAKIAEMILEGVIL